MNPQRCPHCGVEWPFDRAPQATFCGTCGQRTEVPREPSTVGPAVPVPEPARSSAPAAFQRTMLGMPARELAGAPTSTQPGGPAPDARLAAPPGASKTMLGVAMPGIAPVHTSSPPAQAAASPSAPPGPVALPSKHRTMVGVAAPDLLPPHLREVPARTEHGPSVLPAPPPLSFAPLPAPPQLPPKKGISALAVTGILLGVVAVVGGIGAYVALHSPGPLQVAHKFDDAGHETLEVRCPSCPDGTVVSLGAQTGSVVGGVSSLPLPAPLQVGANDLRIRLDRPGSGRDEDVSVHVPVAYRVSLDRSRLGTADPAFVARVEVLPGSRVTLDGHDITVGPDGKGELSIPLGELAAGPSDKAAPFSKELPFSLDLAGGKTETGSVTARAFVVPLRVEAPGALLYTTKATAAVAGQTQKGAVVTVDGQSVPVDAEGRFAVGVALPDSGEKSLQIVASAPALAARTARAQVVRVPSAESARKVLDSEPRLGFDDVASAPEAHRGASLLLEGPVVDARTESGHSTLLIDDRHACKAHALDPKATAPVCLARVLYGAEAGVKVGAWVRVYGRLVGTVAHEPRPLPDVEASFVMTVKASSKR